MKKTIICLFVFSFAWTQCDANGDGGLDILDIITNVNCILDGCWENPEPSGDIYGFWLADSFNIVATIPGYGTQEDAYYCGEYDDYYYEQSNALVINFNEDGQGEEWEIDPSFCGLNEVDLSNPSWSTSWSYSFDGDTLIINFIDDYGNEEPQIFSIETLNEDSLVLYIYEVDYEYGFSFEITYNFHRVTPLNINTTISELNNKSSSLDYRKYIQAIYDTSD